TCVLSTIGDTRLKVGVLRIAHFESFVYIQFDAVKKQRVFVVFGPLDFGPHVLKNYDLCCKMKVKICSKTLVEGISDLSLSFNSSDINLFVYACVEGIFDLSRYINSKEI